jgi:hypothetical protein
MVFTGPPVIGAAIPAFREWGSQTPDRLVLGAVVVVVIWLVVAGLIRVSDAASEDANDEPDVVHEGLYAAVSILHAMLSYYCKQRKCGGDIRATFHRVVPPLDEARSIEQIIPYVGASAGGAGREFSINTGITGHAIRSRTPTIMASGAQSDAEHRRELISDWGYTEAQAKSLTPGRYSAAAIPVLDLSGQKVIGVVYLDSSERSVFERDDVQQIMGVGCQAISDFVTKRYRI